MGAVQLSAGVETHRWNFQIDTKAVKARLQSLATITLFATTLLASAYLSYQNPSHWFWTTFSICALNLYLLPKLLHYGSSRLIKMSLFINFTALASLALGHISMQICRFSRTTLTALQHHHFSSALFLSFLITSLVGYAIPLFEKLLKRAYHLINSEEWKERLLRIHQQFRGMPEVGASFFKADLWQSFLLYFTFLNSKIVFELYRLIRFFISIQPPNYVWQMAASINKIDLANLREMITNLEQLAQSNIQHGQSLPVLLKNKFLWQVKIALRSMSKEDLAQAIPFILSHASKLIPYVFSNIQFLTLLKEDGLEATHAEIQLFLNLMDSWQDLSKRCKRFSQEIIQFEQELKVQDMTKLSSEQQVEFSQRHKKLTQEFNELLAEVKKVYLAKRQWQDFASLWKTIHKLPFKQGDILLAILRDQDLLQNIEQTYRSMLGTGQGENQSISNRLQYITNKLLNINEADKEEEPVSALMFLATHMEFIQKDYVDLQEWFDLDSPHELEETMENIGLKTEEDLYAKGILSHERKFSKQEIRIKIQKYIQQTPKNKLANRIQPANKINKTALVSKYSEKVTRFIYYVISSGLILVPILIQPRLGAIGFVAGSVFFILKRFEIRGTQTIANLSQTALKLAFFPFGKLFYRLLNRRVFSINATRRHAANRFVKADFFRRVQMINGHILSMLFVSSFKSFMQFIIFPSIGGLVQGIALANEVMDLL